MNHPAPANPIAPPEPDLTPDEIVARAAAMRPMLIERAPETERLRRYAPDIHEAFRAAGFYRMFVPRRYGGYEFDVTTFARVVAEIARADMSTAWGLCLASAHALQVAAWFEERAQAEMFGDGDFRAASVAAPVGVARRTDDGWLLGGTHSYCSGIPYSTHYMGQTFMPPAELDGEPTALMLFVVPRSEWTMLEDWGDTLGLKGSGSNSIALDGAHIPADYALENTSMIEIDVTHGTPGSRLHGNPMYAPRSSALFSFEFSALFAGAARGALDEFERTLSTRMTQRPPVVRRIMDPDYQRWFGEALAKVDAAESLMLHCGEQFMRACRRNADGTAPFDRREDLRIAAIAREAVQLSWDAMQGQIFRTAGSKATRDGERMQRFFRDMATGWSHFYSALTDYRYRELAKEQFGLEGDTARGAVRPPAS